MNIRPEVADDRGLVALLYRQAFVGNYEVELIESLREQDAVALALVAVSPDDELIGHIVFAKAQIEVDQRPVDALVLAEMAVHDEHQRQGVGSRLVAHGLDIVRARGVEAVLVLGHPAYYPRFGFSAEMARHLRTPFRGGDAFMAIELVPGSLSGEAGRVTYPAAFGLGPTR